METTLSKTFEIKGRYATLVSAKPEKQKHAINRIGMAVSTL